MVQPIFYINAFASGPFSGNPAAVCPLREWLDDALLQQIAAESQLTCAFFVGGAGRYRLRWFTPATEINGICGHGTLATAFVISNELGDPSEELHFDIAAGELRVRPQDDRFVLDLPALVPKPYGLTAALNTAFGSEPEEVLGATDLIAVFPAEIDVADFEPDLAALAELPLRAAIVTAPGADVDFVSRWFAPKQGEGEDTGFTGSAHCSLVPYWAERLRQKASRGTTALATRRDDRLRAAWRPGLATSARPSNTCKASSICSSTVSIDLARVLDPEPTDPLGAVRAMAGKRFECSELGPRPFVVVANVAAKVRSWHIAEFDHSPSDVCSLR